MRDGLIDVVQVIYNIFEQEPAAQLLPVAKKTGTGIIVRVAFDEGVLTGKYHVDETGKVINNSQFITDLKEAESQIERGEYITIEDLEKEYRSVTQWNYNIIYIVEKDQVRILNIIHTSRHPSK